MPVNAGKQFSGHVEGTELVVQVTTGSAKAAFTTEGNKLKMTAARAGVKSSAMIGIAAVNHLIDIFNDGLPWMKFVKYMFIIVSEDGL